MSIKANLGIGVGNSNIEVNIGGGGDDQPQQTTNPRGLRDRKWEEVQEKAFTRWVNSISAKRGVKVEKLAPDFNDGVKLVQFLESLSSSEIKFTKNIKHKLTKIENINSALNFVKKSGIPLVNISAEDIERGDIKLILGLIWSIILRFQVADITEGELKAKEALLLWVQRKTKGYESVEVKNFTHSFKDGLAFCALIHVHRPNLMGDYKDIHDKMSPLERIRLAFDVAEQHLGVPKLLDPEDIADAPVPDEKAIVAYVSQLYHVFAKDRESEVAARRINNLLDFLNSIEEMKKDYINLSTDLLDWMNKKRDHFEDRNYDGTLNDIIKKIDEMTNYKNNEKLEKEKDKALLETLLNNINVKLRSTNRPPYEPDSNISIDKVNNAWGNLGNEEIKRDDWLENERKKQERLKALLSKLGDKIDKLEAWVKQKEEYLKENETVNSIADAKNKLQRADGFTNEYKQSESRLNQVKQIVDEIVSLNPTEGEQTKKRVEKISEHWHGLDHLHKEKVRDLKDKLKYQEEIEALRLKFAQAVKENNDFLKNATNDVSRREFGDNLKDVLDFEKKLNDDENHKKEESDKRFRNLDDLWNKLQELGVKENRYTAYTIDDIVKGNNDFRQELNARRKAYEKEKQRRLDQDAKCKEFADAAQHFVDEVGKRKHDVKGLNTESDPIVLTKKIDDLYANGEHEKKLLENLNKISNEMAEMGILTNPYTKHTMPSLTLLERSFNAEVVAKKNALYQEQLLKESYVTKSRTFQEKVRETVPTLSEKYKNNDNSLEGAKHSFQEWNDYKSGHSAELAIDLDFVRSTHTKLTNELSRDGRPPYVPPEGLTVDESHSLLKDLHAKENDEEKKIRDELARQEKIHRLVNKFKGTLHDFSSFTEDKEKYFSHKEKVENLSSASKYLRFLKYHKNDVELRKTQFTSLEGIVKQLHDLKYKGVGDLESELKGAHDRYENLHNLHEQKNKDLKYDEEVEQNKENSRIKFAETARDFHRFVQKSNESLEEPYFGNSLETVEEYAGELKSSDDHIEAERHKLFGDVERAAKESLDLGVTENRHTDHDLHLESIKKLNSSLEDKRNTRKDLYGKELSKQQHNDSRRKEFAQKAQSYVDWIDEQVKKVESVSGDASEKLKHISSIYHADEGAGKVKELEELNADLTSNGIFGNKHTPFTVTLLKDRNAQYDNFVKNVRSSLEEEIEVTRKQKENEEDFKKKEAIAELTNNIQQREGEIQLFIDNEEDYRTDDLTRFRKQELESYIQKYHKFSDEGFNAAEGHLNDIKGYADKLKSEYHVDYDVSGITGKLHTAVEAGKNRKSELDVLKGTLEENESLCKKFADEAQTFQSFLEVQKEKASNVPSQNLEESNKILREINNVLETGGKDKLEALQVLDAKINERHVLENPFTQFSLRSLKNSYDAFVLSNKKKIEYNDKQIYELSKTGISDKESEEFRESFEHFDKDKDGKLNALDLYGVLKSLGEKVTEEDAANLLKEIGGPDGLLEFSEYVKLMVKKRADTDTKETYLSAFEQIAGGKHFLTEDDLRRGGFPNERIQYLVRNMPPYADVQGGLDYRLWINTTH